MSAPGVIAQQIKGLLPRDIQKAVTNPFNLTPLSLAGIVAKALERQRQATEPSVYTHQVRPAPTQTAQASEILSNPQIIEIPGQQTPLNTAQTKAEPGIKVRGGNLRKKLANLIDVLGSIEGKAGKQAVELARLSVKNLEAMETV